MVVVYYILSQVNESYVHSDRLMLWENARAVQRTINHIHHPSLPDSHAVPLPRNQTLWNNLCTVCLLLWRFDEIDRGRPRETDLHDHPPTATQYSKPIPAVGQHLSRRIRPLRAMFQERPMSSSIFGQFPFCIDIKCRVRSRRLHY